MRKIVALILVMGTVSYAAPEIKGLINSEGNLIMWAYGASGLTAGPGETVVNDLPSGLKPMSNDTNVCSKLVNSVWVTEARVIVKDQDTLDLENNMIDDIDDFNSKFGTSLNNKPFKGLKKQIFDTVKNDRKSNGKLTGNKQKSKDDLEESEELLIGEYKEKYFRAGWMLTGQGSKFGEN